MEEAIFVICIAIVAVTIAAVAWLKRQWSLRRAYRRVAQRFRGWYVAGRLFQGPSLHFPYQGAIASVDNNVWSEDLRGITRLAIDWPDSATECAISPHTLNSRIRSYLAGASVTVGSPHFHRTFAVACPSREQSGELLSAHVQIGILNLQKLADERRVFVEFAAGKLQIRILGRLRSEEKLRRFVEAGLEIYEQALLTRSAGIDVIAWRLDAPPGDAVCPICGDPIKADVVYCRSCSTAHHLECWRYIGSCSTYACGDKHYRRSDRHLAGGKDDKSFRPNQPR